MSSHIGVHFISTFPFNNLVNEAEILEKDLMNFVYNPMRPKNPLRFVRSLGVGQSTIDYIFLGSTNKPSLDTINPKYSTRDEKFSLFLYFAYNVFSLNICKPCQKCSSCSTTNFEYINILSINSRTNFPRYFWNKVFMRHIKVAEALVKPNGMTRNL